MPVIATAQLNRAPDNRMDKRPQLSDLRASGTIAEDADLVLLLHPVGEDRRMTEIIVGKNRNGANSYTTLFFYPEYSRFDSQ